MPDVEPRFKTYRRKDPRTALDRGEMRNARIELLMRSRGHCEGRFSEICTGYGVQAHHVIRRSQGGPNHPDNLRWLCEPCHTEVHANPARAREAGLLASRVDA